MPNRSRTVRRAAAAGALAALAAACASAPPSPYVDRDGWRAHRAHEGAPRLSGVACGDLDPSSPGDEALAVGDGGAVVLVRCADGAFTAEEVLRTGGELLQVAVGDVDPARPGAEAVAVGVLSGGEDDGGQGVAWLLAPGAPGEPCGRTELARVPALLHAVVVADLEPWSPGNEVALAGFTGEVLLVSRGTDGPATRPVAELPGNAKGMAATPRGLVVACDDGSLVWLARPAAEGGTWPVTDTWRADAPLARVATRGEQVLVCGNDGILRLLQRAAAPPGAGASAFERETRCYAAEDRLRGAVFADVDPRGPGAEAATAGYDGTVRVVRLTSWPDPDDLVPYAAGLENLRVQVELAAEDDAKVHHVAAGRFDGIGEALVTAGHSGRVLVVHRAPDAAPGAGAASVGEARR